MACLLKAFKKCELKDCVLLDNSENIYRAECKGQKVIVKIFDLHTQKRKFWRCHKVHLALKEKPHENIISTVIINNPECYGLIVMPHIEGSDWCSHIVNNLKVPFNPVKILGDFLQMVQAVQHLHNLGFLHLDIKPENFLRDKDGRPILIDFDMSETDNKSITGYT